jgi:putative pyruvate formate lyase activating enzyme
MAGLDIALPRYLSILRGEAGPRFHSTKRFLVDFDPGMELEDLFAVHDQAMRDFNNGEAGEGEGNLLEMKVAIARKILDSCILCERRCGAARSKGRKGHCGVLESRISSEFLHFGEEPELVPSYTIFFSGCTFNCVFCQNYDISQYPSGGEVYSPEVVAELIDRKGAARNVNWVGGDPTSNLRFILDVLLVSDTALPQVWNSNMYLTKEAMALLDGVIDVYLTDFKYGNDGCARRLSKVENYWEIITRNHLLAREQAELIVRHLVLPNHVECCSKPLLDWLAEHLGDKVRVNIMAQYRPMYQAREYPEISRPLKYREFLEARGYAEALGLNLVE